MIQELYHFFSLLRRCNLITVQLWYFTNVDVQDLVVFSLLFMVRKQFIICTNFTQSYNVCFVIVHVARIIPCTPLLLVSLLQEIAYVFPCLRLELTHQSQLAFNIRIWSNLMPLGAVDYILKQPTLYQVCYNVAIEAPDIQVCTLIHGCLNLFLNFSKFIFNFY